LCLTLFLNHRLYMYPISFFSWNFFQVPSLIKYVEIVNAELNQMKWAIHITCTQQFLYFESHKKSIKQLHIIVCFNVLSISSAFTISTYFINEGTWKKFQEKNDIGYMYKRWFKNKVKHKQRVHYICVDLGLTGIN
jgi:hypothetical protein